MKSFLPITRTWRHLLPDSTTGGLRHYSTLQRAPRGAGLTMRVFCTLLSLCSVMSASTAPVMPRAVVPRQGTQEADVRDLKLGQAIEREFKSGEAHIYRMTLTSGQYMHVTVEQLGVNVDVSLSDPKAQQIAALDWWWRDGTESLWALAELTGDYTLKVRASGQPTETGRYRIKVEKIGEWQQASPTDVDIVNAHKNFAEEATGFGCNVVSPL